MEAMRRTPLFGRRGEAAEAGWAREDIFIYNKERIVRPSRVEEWEIYRLLGDGFAFRAVYGHAGTRGLVSVRLTDFDTGETFCMGRSLPNAGDSLDLDFTGDDIHTLKYEEDGLFFYIDYSGSMRRLRFRSEDLDAELSAHNEGEALAALQTYARKGRFRYVFRRCFTDLAGDIRFRNLSYAPDTDSFLSLESVRCLPPGRPGRVSGGGAMDYGGHLVGLSFGYDSGDAEGPTENCLYLDDTMQKLGRVYAKMRADAPMLCWHIFDDADRVHLEFTPEAEDTPHRRFLTRHRSGRVYGRAEGTLALENGRVLPVQDMRFYGEFTRIRV